MRADGLSQGLNQELLGAHELLALFYVKILGGLGLGEPVGVFAADVGLAVDHDRFLLGLGGDGFLKFVVIGPQAHPLLHRVHRGAAPRQQGGGHQQQEPQPQHQR